MINNVKNESAKDVLNDAIKVLPDLNLEAKDSVNLFNVLNEVKIHSNQKYNEAVQVFDNLLNSIKFLNLEQSLQEKLFNAITSVLPLLPSDSLNNTTKNVKNKNVSETDKSNTNKSLEYKIGDKVFIPNLEAPGIIDEIVKTLGVDKCKIDLLNGYSVWLLKNELQLIDFIKVIITDNNSSHFNCAGQFLSKKDGKKPYLVGFVENVFDNDSYKSVIYRRYNINQFSVI